MSHRGRNDIVAPLRRDECFVSEAVRDGKWMCPLSYRISTDDETLSVSNLETVRESASREAKRRERPAGNKFGDLELRKTMFTMFNTLTLPC